MRIIFPSSAGLTVLAAARFFSAIASRFASNASTSMPSCLSLVNAFFSIATSSGVSVTPRALRARRPAASLNAMSCSVDRVAKGLSAADTLTERSSQPSVRGSSASAVVIHKAQKGIRRRQRNLFITKNCTSSNSNRHAIGPRQAVDSVRRDQSDEYSRHGDHHHKPKLGDRRPAERDEQPETLLKPRLACA